MGATGKAITLVEMDVDVFRATHFELGVVGEEPANWMSYWASGLNMEIVADTESSSGKAMRLTRTAGSDESAVIWGLVPNMSDVSIYARLKHATSGVLRGMAIVARTATPFTGYRLQLESPYTLRILRDDTGSTSILATEDFVWDAQVDYWLRFDAVTESDGDVFLRGKVWAGDVTDEPEDFMISVTDPGSDIPHLSGASGLHIFDSDAVVNVSYFRVRSLLGSSTETLRFSKASSYVPTTFNSISNVLGVQIDPSTISLGKDLGKRSRVSVTFQDHPFADHGEFGDIGTYWGRFRGRNLFRRNLPFRVKRGLEGQDIDSFDTFHYVTEEYNGPSLRGGQFTIIAQDMLKLADDNRAQAPRMSQGRLLGAIDNVTTSATLTPTGIGNSNYSASGLVCIGGKEICSYTRSADALTLVRGQNNTDAISHEADERIQEVLNYDGDTPATIIADLLVNYAGVSSSFIPLTEWEDECEENLGGVIYARAITEPIEVRKLISQIIEQAALAVWWDERAQLVRLRVLREISTDADLFTEDTILHNSLQTKEQPKERISQIWTFFQQRNPADRGDNEDNYRQAFVTVDLEKELEYGSQEIRKIIGHWVATENAAERLNQVQISRFRDPPRNFKFDLARGTTITMGNGYRLRWRQNQNELGQEISDGAPIQITRVSYEDDKIIVEAEEMLASGVVTLTTVLILTTTGGILQWEVPADFSSTNNSIHCIGGGGGGSGGTGDSGGAGGGGGAYARKNNLTLTPGALINYQVGEGGDGSAGVSSGSNAAGEDGGDTFFNGVSLASCSCGAEGGTGGGSGTSDVLGGAGGRATQSTGDLKSSGGDGGDGYEEGGSDAGGGGGGGAGGPNGNGGDGGGLFTTDADDGAGGGGADGGDDGAEGSSDDNPGGNNRFDFGGGAGSTEDNPAGVGQEGGGGGGGDRNNQDGGAGGTGEQIWTQTIAPIISAGPGGGGGGGGSFQSGGNGGRYGGGGGGGGLRRPAGDGAQGCIVIVYSDEASTVGPSPTSVSFVTTSTSSGTNITVPAEVIAGDILVLMDYMADGTPQVPTGFTSAIEVTGPLNTNMTLSYKVATGLEAGSSLVGSSATWNNKVLAVFRGDVPANAVSVGDSDGNASSGNPSSFVLSAATGAVPLIVLGAYGILLGASIDPRTFTPAKDDEMFVNDSFFGFPSQAYLAWKIYNSAPADTTIDMDDESDSNTVCGFYLTVT